MEGKRFIRDLLLESFYPQSFYLIDEALAHPATIRSARYGTRFSSRTPILYTDIPA